MNQNLKAHLFSAGVTFVSTFLLTFGASLQGLTTGNLNTDVIVALILTAGRTAFKLVVEDYFQVHTKLGIAK